GVGECAAGGEEARDAVLAVVDGGVVGNRDVVAAEHADAEFGESLDPEPGHRDVTDRVDDLTGVEIQDADDGDADGLAARIEGARCLRRLRRWLEHGAGAAQLDAIGGDADRLTVGARQPRDGVAWLSRVDCGLNRASGMYDGRRRG